MSDAWNRLDCFVVVAGWLPVIFPYFQNFSAARAVRALRPLRTINRVPELRRQVNTLMSSLPQLLDVAMLSAFIMVVFGVLGVQLFKGSFRYRCYEIGADLPLDPIGDMPDGVCSPGEPASYDPADALQGSCAAGQLCKFYGVNPLYGSLSFDTITDAWLLIFQIGQRSVRKLCGKRSSR